MSNQSIDIVHVVYLIRGHFNIPYTNICNQGVLRMGNFQNDKQDSGEYNGNLYKKLIPLNLCVIIYGNWDKLLDNRCYVSNSWDKYELVEVSNYIIDH